MKLNEWIVCRRLYFGLVTWTLFAFPFNFGFGQKYLTFTAGFIKGLQSMHLRFKLPITSHLWFALVPLISRWALDCILAIHTHTSFGFVLVVLQVQFFTSYCSNRNSPYAIMQMCQKNMNTINEKLFSQMTFNHRMSDRFFFVVVCGLKRNIQLMKNGIV